jgi:preprotein translocase subunit SecA
LTASDHKAEAEKIAQAGQEGMVTIATNMAGRGTDILLGDGVEELGGLYVLGTERHESRRIDDQLVGRSGRQGELGESQFLISMEDEIMQLFGSEKIIDAMEGLDIAEDEYISGKSLDEAFKRAQDFVESRNYDSRIYLYKYDRVSNYQRNEVYQLREKLLENEAECERFLLQSVRDVLQGIFLLGDAKLICGQLREKFRIEIDPKELGGYLVAKKKNALPEINLEVRQKFENFLSDRVLQLKSQTEIWQACQNLVLEVIDSNWSRHLELTEILKEEANLLSYASEEPLIDYIIESRNLFAELGKNIQAEFIQSTFTYLAQKGLLEG